MHVTASRLIVFVIWINRQRRLSSHFYKHLPIRKGVILSRAVDCTMMNTTVLLRPDHKLVRDILIAQRDGRHASGGK